MIKLFYTRNSSNLDLQTYSNYLTRLSFDLQEKNRHYVRWQDRCNHLVGQLLLRKGITELGYDQKIHSELRYNEYGRPCFNNELDFNISHSGNIVLCALSCQSRLGVDIEQIQCIKFKDFKNTMSSVQWDDIAMSIHPLKCFFKYWTAKESVVKADRRGLSVPLDTIVFNNNVSELNGITWHITPLAIDAQYSASLATQYEVTGDLEMHEILIDSF